MIHWELVWIGAGGVCAILTAAGGIFAFMLRYVRLMIRSELADFLVLLNGTYLRTPLFTAAMADMERRIARLESRP